MKTGGGCFHPRYRLSYLYASLNKYRISAVSRIRSIELCLFGNSSSASYIHKTIITPPLKDFYGFLLNMLVG
jgi:hypothetical protein